MVKDNRQGGVMQDKEIRLKCLKLVLGHGEIFSGNILDNAKQLYDFVKTGSIELPPKSDIKKVAPKLIDATKLFKQPLL